MAKVRARLSRQNDSQGGSSRRSKPFSTRRGTCARRREAAAGRLIFALDATMSRQPTWDIACKLQGEMFETARALGGLDVQLVYFRGFGECRASRLVARGRADSPS